MSNFSFIFLSKLHINLTDLKAIVNISLSTLNEFFYRCASLFQIWYLIVGLCVNISDRRALAPLCGALVILDFCPEHNKFIISWIDSKPGINVWINDPECSAQELLLCTFYFLSYCPLLIVILYFCPGHISYTIKAID